VGDPFGIISASVGIEFSKSRTWELSRGFEVEKGQFGYVQWTPLERCVNGTFTSCSDGKSYSGRACNPKINKSDGKLSGVYSFVEVGRNSTNDRE
jgi:hypothetical protein